MLFFNNPYVFFFEKHISHVSIGDDIILTPIFSSCCFKNTVTLSKAG